MIRAAFLLTSVVLAGGCTSQNDLSLPEVPGAKAMLLVYSDADRDTQGIFAVDLDQPVVPPFALAESDLFFILTYERTLPELGLSVGRNEIVRDKPDRPLPDGYKAFQASGSDRSAVEIEAQTFVGLMGEIRLRSFASGECEALGGCFRVVAGEEYCSLPCTLPQVVAPMPPNPPRPPDLGECPAGWSSQSDACVPPAPIECGVGEAQLLGDASCTTIAGDCGQRFPTGLGGSVAFADASVPGPGSGTENDPYRTLASALAAGTDSVALAAGTYSDSLVINRTVEIAGACRQTLLTGELSIGGSVTMRNLRLAGANAPLTVDGVLTLTNAEVHGRTQAVQVVGGGAFIGEALLVDDTSGGIQANGGSLTLTRVRILSGAGAGVLATASTATLNDVFISDRMNGPGVQGYGVRALSGSAVTGDRLLMIRTAGEGVAINGAGSTAQLAHVVVRDEPGVWSPKHGIAVTGGASAVIDHALVTNTGFFGIYSDASDLTVRDTVLIDTGRTALRTRTGGELIVERMIIRGPAASGIRTETSEVKLTDVRIEDVKPVRITADGEQAGRAGDGITLSLPERAMLSQVAIERVGGAALYVSSGGSIDIADLSVSNLTGTSRAVSIINTPGSINRMAVENVPARGLDLYSTEQLQLTVNDLRIKDAGTYGLTLTFLTVMGARLEIDGVQDAAILFDRAVLDVSDAHVTNVQGAASMTVGTGDNMDYRESFFQLRKGRFENNSEFPCMVLGFYGVIDASDTVVTGCKIGFEIVVTEVGKERVPPGMLFLANDVNVKTATGE